MLSPLSFFSFFPLSLSVLLFLLSFQENDWLINNANILLFVKVFTRLYALFMLSRSKVWKGWTFFTHNLCNNYPADYFLCASPVGCTNDFYADITALELFSSCWTVWWNSYEAGHRQGVNSNTATTAITFITALHLANLNTFAPLCCSNLKITHTNHHHRCWCIWML